MGEELLNTPVDSLRPFGNVSLWYSIQLKADEQKSITDIVHRIEQLMLAKLLREWFDALFFLFSNSLLFLNKFHWGMERLYYLEGDYSYDESSYCTEPMVVKAITLVTFNTSSFLSTNLALSLKFHVGRHLGPHEGTAHGVAGVVAAANAVLDVILLVEGVEVEVEEESSSVGAEGGGAVAVEAV
ncbi:hypothetical protein K435DRAFT_801781 [Dendrothele bispora CBS 962.96]|uniref:Uncharacterized protein n=1 Tax=Dendrothele bispora (strain CBS 962.96) TaxID=1314807 RepID=A0A4S8LPM9_DENBC|nr:hypothetical protein K435DRAFT_801781 [Dendrothele bispora CBS 962.96]